MNLFRSGTLERRRAGGLGQIRSRYMKRPIVLTPEQERRRARIARITPRPRYMNVMPKPGDWCLFPPHNDRPSVCFDTYQEAVEFPFSEIPLGQGFNVQGRKRDIRCRSNEEPTDLVPPLHTSGATFRRPDDFTIRRILSCADITKR